MSFADFKKKMKDSSNFDKIQSKVEQDSSGGGSYDDPRYWKFEVDSTGNGGALIRFLPQPDGEDFPYVTYYEHSFQGVGGKWYIERSRTSLGKGMPDPVSESNSELWDTGIESNKNIARQRKRHQRFVSNILVINDKANPQNNGKVMLWKYGKSIYNFIQEAINPTVDADLAGVLGDDEMKEPFDPFNFYTGADFRLIAYKNSSGFRSYDKSSWAKQSALYDGDDEKLEEVYNQLHSLEAENTDDKYKPYDELKERFDMVVGNKKSTGKSNSDEDLADEVGEPVLSKEEEKALDDDYDELFD